MSDGARFLGLKKDQFLTAVAVILALTVCAQAYTLWREESLAAQGVESHAALCVFKRDLAVRAQSSQTFLAMTLKQRIAKYGSTLGAIPPSVIRVGLRGQEASLASLQTLHC